jgi:hypothetical protein
MDPVCTRRHWLLQATLVPCALLSVLACKEQEFACDNVTGLSPEQIQIRTNLAYVDRSTNPKSTCRNCQHYVPPTSGAGCGTCKLMPGPTHPQGFCKIWVQLL